RPTSRYNFIGIACGAGLMNDDRGGGAFLSRHLVFVSPATVIRHRFAFEHLVVKLAWIARVWNCRIVNEHDDGLAAHIYAFVVIPTILRRDHSVANKNDIGVFHF